MSKRASAVSRRQFIAAGVSAALGTRLAAAPAAAPLPLITKAIPASGERIPAVGLGTNSFREELREEIRAELARMSELGGSLIDTAPSYGASEAVLGEALAQLGIRERMFLATKVVAGPDASGATGADSLARSLERLKTRRIDLLQVHNLKGIAELLPRMQEWKQAGKIRYIGATTSDTDQHAQMAQLMRRYALDFVQVDYSIANRDAAEVILPLALERKVAVLVNLPFGHSSLLRRTAGRELPGWAADIDVASWAQYFLKYVISHPAVSCAIPGSTRVSHLEDNQAGGRGRLADAAMRRRMEEYFDRRA